MRDKECSICGRSPVEQCHVMDRAEMIRLQQEEDYFNIIFLCSYCHHELFDSGKVAIVPEKDCFIVLYNIGRKKFEIVKSRNSIAINKEYIDWKNVRCHTYLHAVLKKCRDVMMVSQGKSWPCCDLMVTN